MSQTRCEQFQFTPGETEIRAVMCYINMRLIYISEYVRVW